MMTLSTGMVTVVMNAAAARGAMPTTATGAVDSHTGATRWGPPPPSPRTLGPRGGDAADYCHGGRGPRRAVGSLQPVLHPLPN